MNKRIRRIIIFTLSIFSITALYNPRLQNNFKTIVQAYASETTSVYLKDLSLNKSDIDFNQDTYYYETKVDRDVNEIKVTAKPKSSDATVCIDGDFVDENDNYKKVVNLEDGINIIKVKVASEDSEKIYTISILRGEAKKDSIFLDNLSVQDGNINFSRGITNYNINVKESVDKTVIQAIPEQDTYDVTIDGAIASKEENYKQIVELTKGKNPIIIRVNNKKKNEQRVYTLYINREGLLDNKRSSDDIFLNYIKVDKLKININQNKNVYDLNLDKNTSQVDLTVEPEKTEYKVKVNDKIIEDIDNYRDTVTLKPGRNQIIIKLQDEESNKQRIYTLNLNVGAVLDVSDSNKSEIILNNNSEVKYNQWVLENNKWKYFDSTGHTLKDTWFNDKSTNKNYFLKSDGTMAVGWLLSNGCWYYLDNTGARQSGWIYSNGKWYYLDSDGIMRVGWIKDLSGKYYYLLPNGDMAKNIEIDGCRLGSDGAWIR